MSKAKPPVDELSRAELIKLVRMQAAAIVRLEKRVKELEAKLKEKNPTKRVDLPYSQNAEDKRQEDAKGSKGGRGRKRLKAIAQGTHHHCR